MDCSDDGDFRSDGDCSRGEVDEDAVVEEDSLRSVRQKSNSK